MAYIGKSPTIGNFQKCDAITVVNGQAAYTLQVGGTNVVPESVNHMLVSLNGILQAPTDSFTVSGSTLTFASNLATGDVIDFVMILGNVLDLGVPSDNTVTTAKLGANAVTAAKLNNDIISGTTALTSAPDDTDEFLVSDAGTLKRIDYSLIKSDPTHVLLSTTTISSGTASVSISSDIDSTYKVYMLELLNLHPGNDGENLHMRFLQGGTEDSGSIYDYAYSRAIGGSGAPADVQSTNIDYIRLADSTDAINTGSISGRILLYNPSSTTYPTNVYFNFTSTRNGNNIQKSAGVGRIDEAVANDGVKFFMSTGNLDDGIIKLYGVN